MADANEYLQPDFDPSTLTVPRLRSILVAHNVAYPSSAKKPDLINIFRENIAIQATKLRNAQSRTKRSARGIVDVPSSQASTVDPDELVEEPEPLPSETPGRRTSRRTTRVATEEPVTATPRVPRSSRQSTAPPPPSAAKRSSTAKYLNVDGAAEETATKSASRRSRQSVSPALAAQVEDEEPAYRDDGAESPFTQENPFQSGSSPPSDSRSKSRDRRRTTMERPVNDERRKSRDSRRQTDGYGAVKAEDGIARPARTRRVVTPAKPIKQESEDEMVPGEEFAPEEQLELELANTHGTVVRAPKKKQARSGVAKAAPWSVFVALLGGIATVWRQEKLQVGYCGVGLPSTAVAGIEIPEWASALQPQCEPCPQHAYCYANLETVCEPDFVLTPHPLALGGAVPLPPTCEPDSEKVRKIKQVADFAVETELRERNAKYECGEIKTREIPEEDLKATVSAKRSRKMSDDEFNELWDHALGEIVGREEVISRVSGSQRLLRSTSLARISLSCAVRRSLVGALRQHLPKLVAIVLLSLSAVYGRHALTVRRSTTSRAKQLAGVALDKLALQASLHAEDPDSYPEPWISMVALRDDVLREEFSASARTRLWDVVKGLVEGNANVRPMVREGRMGDVSRVWEWIGAVQRIESPESGRRSSKRFSLGGVGRIAGSPDGRLLEAKNDEAATPEMGQIKKWEEGKSAYY